MSTVTEVTATERRSLARRAASELEEATAAEIMSWAYTEFGERLVVTTSLADTAMVHLAAQTAPGMDVVFLDTGYHFVETLGTRDAVQAMYDVHLISVTPEQSVAEQDATHGAELFARDPDRCCALRKVAPLDATLRPYAAWASGVRRADSVARARTPVVSYDLRRDLVRISPLARWSDADLADYIEQHNLLVNPLLMDGYPSIGCEPCTVRADADAGDPRAGRWAGRSKTECGIHR